MVLLIIALALTYYPATHMPAQQASVEIIDQSPSFYGQLQIARKDKIKMMLVDGIGQNYVADNQRYTTPYINFISSLPALLHAPDSDERALVIGLGAGQLPMLLQDYGLGVDVVEIDPVIAEMANKHFSMNLDDKNIFFTDGRVFLRNSSESYKYIIIDAFNADQIAWHLMSKESIELTKLRLSNGGLLAINLTSIADGVDVASIQKTLMSVYRHVSVFSYTPDHKYNLSSIVFAASDSPIELSIVNNRFEDAQLADINHFINGRLAQLEGGLVLTDDFNPLDHQRDYTQLVWRQAMRDYLGEENLGWLLF